MGAFVEGTRVQRRFNVFDEKSPLRHGVVVKKYSETDPILGEYPELYQVWWDDGQISGGYFPHGLSREEQ